MFDCAARYADKAHVATAQVATTGLVSLAYLRRLSEKVCHSLLQETFQDLSQGMLIVKDLLHPLHAPAPLQQLHRSKCDQWHTATMSLIRLLTRARGIALPPDDAAAKSLCLRPSDLCLRHHVREPRVRLILKSSVVFDLEMHPQGRPFTMPD